MNKHYSFLLFMILKRLISLIPTKNTSKMKMNYYLFLTCLMFSTPLAHYAFAKNKPIYQSVRQTAFERAKSLNNGINISWLEQTWDAHVLDTTPVTKADFVLLKKLGFKSIRLPVA